MAPDGLQVTIDWYPFSKVNVDPLLFSPPSLSTLAQLSNSGVGQISPVIFAPDNKWLCGPCCNYLRPRCSAEADDISTHGCGCPLLTLRLRDTEIGISYDCHVSGNIFLSTLKIM